MSTSKKSFDGIQTDYAFFMENSTEELNIRHVLRDQIQLARQRARGKIIRILDFGCGTGELLENLIIETGLNNDDLEIGLVDPVVAYREQARKRLERFSKKSVLSTASLKVHTGMKYDIILVNHVLYYVPSLDQAVSELLSVATDTTSILVTMAANANDLIQYWLAQFPILGIPMPYNLQTDFEHSLASKKRPFNKIEIRSQLVFEDTIENRKKIARFLLGSHHYENKNQSALDHFEIHSNKGKVQMGLIDHLFVIFGNGK